MRDHNDSREPRQRAGFFGLDLYSMHTSIEKVLGYLDEVDPEAAARARQRYACFDHYGDDAQQYGYSTSLSLTPPCEREVVQQLIELRRQAAEYLRPDGRVAAECPVLRRAERAARSQRRGLLPKHVPRPRIFGTSRRHFGP